MVNPLYTCPLHDGPVRFSSKRKARNHILTDHDAGEKLRHIWENELIDFDADSRIAAYSEINDATTSPGRVNLLLNTEHPKTDYARRRKLSNGQYDPPKTLRLTITGRGTMAVDVIEAEGMTIQGANASYQVYEEPNSSGLQQSSTNNPHESGHPLHGQ